MCCFYLSSNICSFSTQNINFYIDFPYSIVKDQIPRDFVPSSHASVLVGLDGLEPSTSRLSGARSNHLSYRPFSTHLASVRLHCFGLLGFVDPRSLSHRVTVVSLHQLSPSLPGDTCRLVEMKGIEPLTPCLQGRCSPS